MKILMLGWELPPNISGGLGTACFGITRGLHELGELAVTFVIPHIDNGEDRRFVELVALGGMAVSNATGSASSYGNNLLGQVRRYERQASTLLRGDRSWDVIHAHDWLTVPAALRLKRLTGKPLILHVHSTEYDRAGSYADPAIVEIERQGLDAANRIIAVSRYTRDMLVERYGQNPARISVVYNAVCDKWGAPAAPRARTGAATVSFLGRVTYQKGPRYFIEAARLALDMNPELQFVMAGDGDSLQDMKALAHALGIDGSVYFPGFLRNDEVRHLLCHTDIYVMPSVSEPFGISALEAIHAGAAAILSRQSGVVEILKNVVAVDYWDSAAMANAIVDLANDQVAAARMTQKAIQELDHASWRNCAVLLTQLYRQVVSESKTGALVANY